MVFSSITFLFYFLPAALLLYIVTGPRHRNLMLLMTSLFFYAWGEGIYLLLMLTSIFINYFGALYIDRHLSKSSCRWVFAGTLSLNLLILLFFKYANFLTQNINILLDMFGLSTIDLNPVRLPIGISFYTFQGLSYVIDVYRGSVQAQKRIVNLALYISLFPQLIAGPIVRYGEIAGSFLNRPLTAKNFTEGIQRFVFGISKKVLIANPLAEISDTIFSLPGSELTFSLSWLGALCYTMQIYFDFSGYSDMAIGIGRILGFQFPENFNYPYISQSIREFWRRWHISLSRWFQDYLYIPFGGNRLGKIKTCRNLLIVFLLCGFWHGANWTFMAWGLYHGFFLALERTWFGKIQERLWFPVRAFLTFIIVMVGWVIFRCEALSGAIHHIGVMAGMNGVGYDSGVLSSYVNNKSAFELIMAIILSFPLYPAICLLQRRIIHNGESTIHYISDISYHFIHFSLIICLFYFSVISLSADNYNPFIYFRF